MSPEGLIAVREKIITPEEFFSKYPPSSDMDGVLCNTRKHVVEEFNKMFGTLYTTFDIRDYHAVSRWAGVLGMGKKEAMAIENKLWFDPNVLFRAKPLPGAVKFTRWFAERNIDLPVVTSRESNIKDVRKPNIEDVTIAWFRKWMPWIKEENIYMQKNQEMPGDIFKAWMNRVLGRGIHFEDVPGHAKAVLDYTDASVVLLSNLIEIDGYYPGRLLRIPETKGIGPEMHRVNEIFLGI